MLLIADGVGEVVVTGGYSLRFSTELLLYFDGEG